MFHLARWLVRHLNDPLLIIWLAQRGGQFHERWTSLIEQKLDRFARLEREGNATELDRIRAHAPNAIPGPLMQTLWRLLLTGRLKSPWRELSLHPWKVRLKGDGLTTMLRLELRELLAPKVKLQQPFRWDTEEASPDHPTHIKQLVNWELVLATDHVRSSLPDLADQNWRKILPDLLDDFQQLLRDALDLRSELGEADGRNDHSHYELPSISPHRQNRGFHDWVALIELLRDAWLETREGDHEHSTRVALGWFDSPYSVFKRLALFAASQDGCIAQEQWVEWLIAEEAWCLWSEETRREVMRLLVLQARNLLPDAMNKLEAAILAGPPRAMYRGDIEAEHWQSLVDHSIWLRLSKFREGRGSLGNAASQVINTLSAKYPDWKIKKNLSDEFPFWMGGTGDPDYEASRDIDIAPRKRGDLVMWLKQTPSPTHQHYEDTWRATCQKRAANAGYALADLAKEGLWPGTRWSDAFYAWSERGRPKKTWRCFAAVVRSMPEEVVKEIEHSLTAWLQAVSKVIDLHETIFLDLCRRVMELQLKNGTGIIQDGKPIDRPVTEAINHPIGHVTQALLNLWFKRAPNDGDSLPGDIAPFFTQICDVGVVQYRHGRVLLASQLIALFRVDRLWTETNLLPLFDWDRNPLDATAVWEGFLWSPRLYPPLLIAFKPQFLATAQHYSELGDHSRQYAAFIAYAALAPVAGYVPNDFQSAIRALPIEGLEEVAQALSQALEGAGEQREDYWKNRVQPFWQQVWPKSGDLVTNSIAESLARLSIAARGEFPIALSAVIDWLRPIEYPDYLIHLLHESSLAARFPEDALKFLSAVIENQPWAPSELGQCLKSIAMAAPAIEQDQRYQKLVQYLRRHEVES